MTKHNRKADIRGQLRLLLRSADTDEDYAIAKFHQLIDRYGCGEVRKALVTIQRICEPTPPEAAVGHRPPQERVNRQSRCLGLLRDKQGKTEHPAL